MSGSAEAASVADYRFTPDDLRVDARLPGISAFMRIRNGADFLETAVRSHIAHFDEIVAVYNQCTDATPDILARLAQEFGPQKLRVFHYLPKVFPPGSEGHAREPANSPLSLVNYYNFALAETRHRIVTKLDDDHLAMEPALAAVTAQLRGGWMADAVACFSGPNLARDATGRIGVLAREPFSGNGDIGFFRVSPETYFVHDRRFERFRRGGLGQQFVGFLYWHLKYLKPGLGFANYDLGENPNSRYARKHERLVQDMRVVAPEDVPGLATAKDRIVVAARKLGLPLGRKSALRADRWQAAADLPPLPVSIEAGSVAVPA